MIELSAAEFDVVWRDCGYRKPPEPLQILSVGRTDEERIRIRNEVYRALGDRGLWGGKTLTGALPDLLKTLATAQVFAECEARPDMSVAVPLLAVAASNRGRVILAEQVGTKESIEEDTEESKENTATTDLSRSRVRLTDLGNADPFSAVVAVLPTLTRGPGSEINLPVSAFENAPRNPDSIMDTGAAGSPQTRRQLREAHAIHARPVNGAGLLSVRVREPSGKLNRVGGVSWFCTDQGAYEGTIDPVQASERWLRVMPTDTPALADSLAKLAHTRISDI